MQTMLVGLQGTSAFLPVKWEPWKILSRGGTALTQVFTGTLLRPQELCSRGREDSLEARKPEEVTPLVQVSNDGACTGRWHLETWSDLASVSVAGSTALAGS